MLSRSIAPKTQQAAGYKLTRKTDGPFDGTKQALTLAPAINLLT